MWLPKLSTTQLAARRAPVSILVVGPDGPGPQQPAGKARRHGQSRANRRAAARAGHVSIAAMLGTGDDPARQIGSEQVKPGDTMRDARRRQRGECVVEPADSVGV